MTRVAVYDFRAFCQGDLLRIDRRQFDRVLTHIAQHQKAYASMVYFTAVLLMPKSALAAGAQSGSGGLRLLFMMQRGAFWLGMAVTVWGIIEAQLDTPGWKARILKGVLGYVGVLLTPLVFIEIRHSMEMNEQEMMQRLYEGGS